MIGQTVGPYRVVEKLGEGGMGEVYRARDPRLERDVAVKALPSLFQADADRVTRFEREAQILASLNHPHIARLYGLEEARGSRFLVLELVEGGTLASRLRAGPLSIPQALTIARQIADALGAAHDKGIIHRDLKPANVGLSADVQVKVLDFGLAKAFSTDQSPAAETRTHVAATDPGTFMGTVAYMSPEQLRGLPLDKRTDIWAFGCVLFEMLAGSHPFARSTSSDTIAAILNVEPDWSPLPAATPPRLRWLLRRCLEKDAARRVHDIADARIELEEMLVPGFSAMSAAEAAPPSRMQTREKIAWGVAALGLLSALAWFGLGRFGLLDNAPGEASPVSASIVLPDGLRLWALNPAGRFALSPNGRSIVVVVQDSSNGSQLWVRPLHAPVGQLLAGTEGATFPFWSSDSRSIAFFAGGKLKRIDVTGGPVGTICDAASSSSGAWSQSDVILFTPRPGSALHRVPATGGKDVPATTLDESSGDAQHWFPAFLPDGRHFLFFVVGSATGGMTDPRGVYLGELDSTTAPRRILASGSNARYANGHLIFLQDGTLTAQRFDAERLELSGEPHPLAEQVLIAGAGATGTAGAFSLSTNGILAYQAGSITRSQLVWLDRQGKELGRIGDQADYADAVLSPNDASAAVSVMDPATATRDIWVYDLARGHRERLTFDRSDDFAPVWSPDGGQLLYSSIRSNGIQLYQRPAAPGGSERIVVLDRLGKFAADWSRDGKFLAYVGGGGIIGRSDLWIAPVGGAPYAFAETSFVETQPRFSPDGEWLAFSTVETGSFEVYISPFPGPGRRIPVSTDGGRWARWSRTGRELFYLKLDNTLMSVSVEQRADGLRVGTPRPLFALKSRPSPRLDAYPYDLSRDGRILVNGFVEDITTTPITLVTNWPSDIRR
jgi:Tol biopolymer transport system component